MGALAGRVVRLEVALHGAARLYSLRGHFKAAPSTGGASTLHGLP